MENIEIKDMDNKEIALEALANWQSAFPEALQKILSLTIKKSAKEKNETTKASDYFNKAVSKLGKGLQEELRIYISVFESYINQKLFEAREEQIEYNKEILQDIVSNIFFYWFKRLPFNYIPVISKVLTGSLEGDFDEVLLAKELSLLKGRNPKEEKKAMTFLYLFAQFSRQRENCKASQLCVNQICNKKRVNNNAH